MGDMPFQPRPRQLWPSRVGFGALAVNQGHGGSIPPGHPVFFIHSRENKMTINPAHKAFGRYRPSIRVYLPLPFACLLIDATDNKVMAENEKRVLITYIQSQLDAGGHHPIPESEGV